MIVLSKMLSNDYRNKKRFNEKDEADYAIKRTHSRNHLSIDVYIASDLDCKTMQELKDAIKRGIDAVDLSIFDDANAALGHDPNDRHIGEEVEGEMIEILIFN